MSIRDRRVQIGLAVLLVAAAVAVTVLVMIDGGSDGSAESTSTSAEQSGPTQEDYIAYVESEVVAYRSPGDVSYQGACVEVSPNAFQCTGEIVGPTGISGGRLNTFAYHDPAEGPTVFMLPNGTNPAAPELDCAGAGVQQCIELAKSADTQTP